MTEMTPRAHLDLSLGIATIKSLFARVSKDEINCQGWVADLSISLGVEKQARAQLCDKAYRGTASAIKLQSCMSASAG